MCLSETCIRKFHKSKQAFVVQIIEGLDEQGKKFKGKYFFGTDGEAISFQVYPETWCLQNFSLFIGRNYKVGYLMSCQN